MLNTFKEALENEIELEKQKLAHYTSIGKIDEQ